MVNRIVGGVAAVRRRATGAALALVALAALAGPPGAVAQDQDMPKGVRLRLTYETQYRPRLAVQPFTGTATGRAAEEVHRIVQRDLDYSDRFDMMFSVPAALRSGPVDYAAWNDLGAVFLVTAGLEPNDAGYGLRVALHDVVYGSVKEIRQFQLPPMDAPGFRMAVHAASDEVVRWATGEQGMAATRVAMTRHLGDGTYELLLVDSDGENLQRVESHLRLYSPTWSPDGSTLAYGQGDENQNRLVERTLASGSVRALTESRSLAQTPSYSPDGRRLAMALWIDRGMGLFSYDAVQGCCLQQIARRPGQRVIDMHPSFSPDGRRIVFQSDRLGNPHIFLMSADGGDAVLLTQFERGGPGFYFGPEWSPRSSEVVFTGRSRGGINQIMVADAARPGGPVQQITSEGRSEDPSWAPDGRHVVFSGVREDGMGLYVIDLITGRIRPLVTGGRYRMPDWSPVLVRASTLTATP